MASAQGISTTICIVLQHVQPREQDDPRLGAVRMDYGRAMAISATGFAATQVLYLSAQLRADGAEKCQALRKDFQMKKQRG
jgi:hypothetical protein